MKFGIVFPHNEIGNDPRDIKEYAQRAEKLGADHMLIYDHVLGADPDRPGGFNGPYDKDIAFHEPFTVFSFMAAVTDKIDFSTSVLILPQRQTALVAKQASQLAILSNNRFRLGIGTGWNTVEYEALDIPFEKRGRRQAEQVDLLRKLWRSDSMSFDGNFHTVTKASILPRPTQTIPIWFGGGSPALLKRCATLGDGWVPIGGPNEASAQSIEVLKQHRKDAGLSWDNFGIQAQAQFAGGTPERWLKHAQRWRNLGCTHLAVATHNAGNKTVTDHLRAAQSYFDAVSSVS